MKEIASNSYRKVAQETDWGEWFKGLHRGNYPEGGGDPYPSMAGVYISVAEGLARTIVSAHERNESLSKDCPDNIQELVADNNISGLADYANYEVEARARYLGDLAKEAERALRQLDQLKNIDMGALKRGEL